MSGAGHPTADHLTRMDDRITALEDAVDELSAAIQVITSQMEQVGLPVTK